MNCKILNNGAIQIGFMQGRLCNQVDGKIQAFPWQYWETEFPLAKALSIPLMEWTLDQDRLYENPLMTPTGQAQIRRLSYQYGVAIPSLTGDCFMQTPFWKASGSAQLKLKEEFQAIFHACAEIGIQMIVVPLVDHGRLETTEQEDNLVKYLLTQQSDLANLGVSVLFESDFSPAELARFIDRLPHEQFGLNYDIGNSAALGFDPREEFAAYGHRVLNVHVKDKEGLPADQQPVKPVTYSVIKAGLVGLTRYLGTYWCDQGVRCNSLSPGGVFNGQSEEFVQRLSGLIPLGRMADREEYRAVVQFLCSDASRYMTGQNIVIDGGRSVW